MGNSNPPRRVGINSSEDKSATKTDVPVQSLSTAADAGSISLQHGSDADFEHACTPCGEDRIRAEAVKYCSDCREYLCQTCTRHHGRQKATRSHKLLDESEADHGPLIANAVKCRYHPDRDIEMYCVTHNMVYCLKCVAMGHRSSCDVKCIDSTLCSSNQEEQMLQLQKDLVEIRGQLLATKEMRKKNIELVEKQRNDCLTTVKKIEEKLSDHIQKLKHETTTNVLIKSGEIETELQSDIASITDLITEVERMNKQLDGKRLMDAELEFIQIKIGQKCLEDANIMKSREISELSNVTEDTDLCSKVLKAETLGHINMSKENTKPPKQRKQIRMKSMREVNVKMQNDGVTCLVNDACQLKDGTIILVDYNNKKLKRLDENYTIKDCYTFDAGATGICNTAPNEVVVKLSNDRIQYVSVGGPFSLLRYMQIKGGYLFGIEYDGDGELLVPYENKVNRYDVYGAFIKSIDKTPGGQNIFVSSTSHMVAHNGGIIVTDGRDRAVHVRKDGTVLRKFRNERLQGVRAVCKSNEGIIFLAGRYSHNILMFDEDGKCLGDLMSGGLGDPISMCYDNKKDCIIVSRFQSNTICVVELDK